MSTQKREIAEKYELPEHPFLYGMASAFDMFGVLGCSRNERLLANLREDSRRRSERDIRRSAWKTVGESLLFAMDQYDKAAGESSSM